MHNVRIIHKGHNTRGLCMVDWHSSGRSRIAEGILVDKCSDKTLHISPHTGVFPLYRVGEKRRGGGWS